MSARTDPLHEETDLDPAEDPTERQNSNMIFTFHVYQYLVDKVGTGESELMIIIIIMRELFHFIFN